MADTATLRLTRVQLRQLCVWHDAYESRGGVHAENEELLDLIYEAETTLDDDDDED